MLISERRPLTEQEQDALLAEGIAILENLPPFELAIMTLWMRLHSLADTLESDLDPTDKLQAVNQFCGEALRDCCFMEAPLA